MLLPYFIYRDVNVIRNTDLIIIRSCSHCAHIGLVASFGTSKIVKCSISRKKF
jgi:hypothetical protein